MSRKARFLMVAPARSGSTVLRTTLNGHSEVICHGEVLGRNRILGLVRRPETPSGEALYRMRGESVLEFLETGIFAPLDDAGAAGFKALYYHFGELQFAEAIDHLISSADIKIIFLWRNDLVKRALSEVQHRMMAASRDTPSVLSVERIEQDCRNQLTCAAWLQNIFSGHPCIRISYEALVADQQRTLDEICEFLGVAGGAIRLPDRQGNSRSTEARRSAGIVERWRTLAGSKVPAEQECLPYPLVSNAASLLEAEALVDYRNILPWK